MIILFMIIRITMHADIEKIESSVEFYKKLGTSAKESR